MPNSVWIGIDRNWPGGPSRVIRLLADGANSPKYAYPFAGNTIQEQTESVRLLGQAMEEGEGSLVTKLSDLVDCELENWSGGAQQVVSAFFAESDMLSVDGVAEAFMATTESRTLLQCIEDVGEYIVGIF
jgi:hypothetical protein